MLPHSAIMLSKELPWIMKAVLAKSATSVYPLRHIFAPVVLFNSQVRSTGVNG
jgi:hypothetical protein